MINGWSVGPDGAPGPVLEACLRAAIAAPSVHNTQPWRFRLGDGVIDVYADPTRRLAVLDPTGRELMISVGAAVLNLRVAMLAHGRMPVLRLLSDDGGRSNDLFGPPAAALATKEPTLAARVRLGPSVAAPDTAIMLSRAIPQRHTNRRPFSAIPVPPEVLADLAAAARVEGGDLVVADAPVRDAVLGVVRAAEHRRRADPAYRAELAEWTREIAHRRDGVPPEAIGPWDALEIVPIRDFRLTQDEGHLEGQPVRRRASAPFEDEPSIAVLYTAGDTPWEWLRAGQALERALLTATVRGLATTLMTQPLEIPDLRALLTDSASGRVAQAIVRFGYGPPSPPTPRRSISDLLMHAEPGQVTLR